MERKHVALYIRCITFKVSEARGESFHQRLLRASRASHQVTGERAVLEAPLSEPTGFREIMET